MGRRAEVSRQRERRLTLADIMLFVAATAPGLAFVRFAGTLRHYNKLATEGVGKVRLALEALSTFGTPVLVPWTLLVLVLSLRGPRPSLRRVVGRPGFVASACVALSLILEVPDLAILAYRAKTAADLDFYFAHCVTLVTFNSGATILGAWPALALAGRWGPGRSWLDRLGFCLDLFYIFFYFYYRIYFTILPLL